MNAPVPARILNSLLPKANADFIRSEIKELNNTKRSETAKAPHSTITRPSPTYAWSAARPDTTTSCPPRAASLLPPLPPRSTGQGKKDGSRTPPNRTEPGLHHRLRKLLLLLPAQEISDRLPPTGADPQLDTSFKKFPGRRRRRAAHRRLELSVPAARLFSRSLLILVPVRRRGS